MYMSVEPACMSVHRVWCLQRPEEGIRCHAAEVTDGCKPPCGWLGIQPRSSTKAVSAVNCTETHRAL